MDRALCLLIGLQLWGWVRFIGRSLRTLKGLALALLGAVVFAPWLMTMALTPPESRADPETVWRFGPIILLVLTILSVLFSFTVQRAISFTPAEINFLFPGPFSRRQLLAYKIATSLGAGLLATPIVALALRHHSRCLLSAWVGLVLMLMFLQLFATVLALLASTVGARAYNRSRRLLLAGLVVAAVTAAFWAGKEAVHLGPRQVLEQMEQSPLWSALLAPFRWFVGAFLAERPWPDLVVAAGPGLAVNLLLLLLIFALDAQYLEAAAASSERVYAQLERMRTGGVLAVGLSGSGKARLSLPSLPWWGGAGPHLWRQLLGAQRSFMPLVVLAVFYGIVLLPIGLAIDVPRHDFQQAAILTLTLFGITPFLTTMIVYDFRADIDRMELLKTLPVSPSLLAVGQLAAPVLLVGTLQLAVLTITLVLQGSTAYWVILIAAAFAFPFNFLFFGIENLLFLWFPTRLIPTTPGDFQLMGRHILLMMAKVLAIVAALGPAACLATAALVVASVLGAEPAVTVGLAMAGAWLGLVGMTATLVPLIGLAFERFDVSRDLPP
ncbi:MAG TPA: putative ABC exporter domain-containing protein [Gemmataceae bacterium]|nr:putative ABC exporter domain-containing protein [Gemmataceae bacterium]